MGNIMILSPIVICSNLALERDQSSRVRGLDRGATGDSLCDQPSCAASSCNHSMPTCLRKFSISLRH